MKTQFERVREWAKNRDLYSKGDPKTQFVKLIEEVGETGRAILKSDEPEIKDGLGDAFVVLVNLSELCGYRLEDCIEDALKVIEARKGKMINGTFVKEDDLKVQSFINKKCVKLKKHKNGYYNLPCQHKDIVSFMKENNLNINNKIYDENDNIHLLAKPSKKIGGQAYIYIN